MAIPPEPTTQIIGGSFQDAEGNPLANGYIIFEINQDELVTAVGVEVCSGIKVRVPLDINGDVLGTINTDPPIFMWANDEMAPANSYYIVNVYTAEGQLAWGPNVQQILTSPNPYDLDLWTPNQIIDWNPPLQGLTLQTNGVNNSSQSVLNLTAGQNITIVDNGGGVVTISAQVPGTVATVAITAAQLKNLVASPVQLLPAPGIGQAYFVSGVNVQYKYGGIAYTIPYGDGDFVVYPLAEGPTGANWMNIRRKGFIDTSSSQVAQSPNNYMAYLPQASLENQPIVLGTDAVDDITTGTGTFIVTLYYTTLTLQ